MNLEELRNMKIDRILCVFENAMLQKYKGGTKVVVPNYDPGNDDARFGCAVSEYIFTEEDLEFIKNDGAVIKELRNRGWEMQITMAADDVLGEDNPLYNTVFIFTAIEDNTDELKK